MHHRGFSFKLNRRPSLLRRAIDAVCASLRQASAPAPVMIDRLEDRRLLAADPVITEFLAANINGLAAQDSSRYDWIEIYNPNASALSLKDYFLTDNSGRLTKWRFPDISIPANDFLVVFASGKDLTNPANPLHTNFSLDESGEFVALVKPDGLSVTSQFDFGNQQEDISFGRDPASGTDRFFATPTPRAVNRRSEVVINEIHYDPDVKTELVEFIELYNPGMAEVNLAGARFSAGVDYTFPAGTVLPAGGYLIVSENPAAFQAKFPGQSALGPWIGGLANEGETITLRNVSGGKLDEVDYGAGFPWPTVGDAGVNNAPGTGFSIELINPDFDNNLGGNWRVSVSGPLSQEMTLFSSAGSWHYRKGTSEASTPKEAWRGLSFIEDGTWYPGTGPAGFDNDVALPGTPNLGDMKGNYSSFFLRKIFTVSDPSQLGLLRLEAMYDDGFVAWINGNWVYTQYVGSNNPNVTATSNGGALEIKNYVTFSLPSAAASYLVPGDNVIAVQVFNASKSGSTDAYFDARLIASTVSSAGPTPAADNSVYAANAAPQMRQVEHLPRQPVSYEPVTITAKVTDPQGVASVNLEYQLVDPGNYIRTTLFNPLTNRYDPAPEYAQGWVGLAMKDDGVAPDAVAGDGIYSVQMSPELQQHRRLVRYRITATDGLGLSITAPYADDPTPNFAYYVYDGVPSWSGAIEPGSFDPARGEVVTYDFSQMTSMPVYQLITRAADHQDAQHIPTASTGGYTGEEYKWSGTLVYDGVVYDNIHYRARGGVWRYAMGKNMWKFDLNRNHEFQARDEYGKLFKTTWRKVNLGANIQQVNFSMRGEQGLFEYVGFKLFNLAGSPASNTLPVHFRIVENASETNNTASQYDDDFQGLYLAVEQPDGRLLDEHGMPDGNLYKMESGTGTLNNQGPTQPSDRTDLDTFRSTLLSSPSDDWIRQNIDLDAYYNYRAMIEAVHHWDIGSGKNYFWFHNPDTDKWEQVAWDLDLTWTNTYNASDNEPFRDVILGRAAFQTDYKNRIREIRDLLFNIEQVSLMLEEYATLVDIPTGAGASMVDADRAMWDYNPIMASSYVNAGKAGQGRFYTGTGDAYVPIPSPGGFRGMVQIMKDYVLSQVPRYGATRGGVRLDNLAFDAAIPAKPTLSYVGASRYPANDLRFRSSNFMDTTGAFAAMKWRLADVTPVPLGQRPNYEANAIWESPELTSFTSDMQVPSVAVVPGRTYRVRVKMKDDTGRWSNWSDPVQFVPTRAVGLTVMDSLRITEINYNPPGAGAGSPYTGDDFEFIELSNTGSATLNLRDVKLRAGIEFDFTTDLLLAPGEKVVVARNPAAFATRYGTRGMKLAGPFLNATALSNGGEQIVLLDAVGQSVQDFEYNDAWYSSTDGNGKTLVIIDPTAPVGAWNLEASWRPSIIDHGTPGADESAVPEGAIVINEILTHTDQPGGDWIELYNTTDQPIPIGGWWLSDDIIHPQKFRIPDGVEIPAYGYWSFDADTHFNNPAHPGALEPFALRELGDEVSLASAIAAGPLSGYKQVQNFGAADPETPFARYLTSTGATRFAPASGPTRDEPNAPPRVGNVVINEIMYHPPAVPPGFTDEYIELFNRSAQSIPLFDPLNPSRTWRFIEGINYAFPANLTLAPGQSMLVVPIDPETFRAKYALPSNLLIVGPYQSDPDNVLDNGGERLTLARPGTADPPNYEVPWIAEDSIRYNDTRSWGLSADGLGAALGRIDPAQYGDDALNWTIETPPSPGSANTAHPLTATITLPDPNPRPNSVPSLSFAFSDPVPALSLADLSLTRNGSANLLSGQQSLLSADGKLWTLGNLGKLTVPEGLYTLTLHAGGDGVADGEGRRLMADVQASFAVTTTTLDLAPGSNSVYVVGGADVRIYVNTPPSSAPTYTLALDQITSLVVNGASGNDFLSIDGPLPFNPIFNGAEGSDTLMLLRTAFWADADLSQGRGNLSLVVGGGTNIVLGATQRLAALSIQGNGVVQISPELKVLSAENSPELKVLSAEYSGLSTQDSGLVLLTRSLSIGPAARLDLGANRLILRSTPEKRAADRTLLNTLLGTGRRGGSWDGPGICSAAAAADSAQVTGLSMMPNQRLSLWGTEPVTANDLLVGYTWTGDLDLNGRVDASDYFLMNRAQLKQIPGPGLDNGDLDLTGTIDLADYSLIDRAFLSSAQNSPELKVLSAEYSALSTPDSGLRTQHSALSTPDSGLRAPSAIAAVAAPKKKGLHEGTKARRQEARRHEGKRHAGTKATGTKARGTKARRQAP